MTQDEIEQKITSLWSDKFPETMQLIGPAECKAQRDALARMTLGEMERLEQEGLDEDAAWLEARHICLAPPLFPDS